MLDVYLCLEIASIYILKLVIHKKLSNYNSQEFFINFLLIHSKFIPALYNFFAKKNE